MAYLCGRAGSDRNARHMQKVLGLVAIALAARVLMEGLLIALLARDRARHPLIGQAAAIGLRPAPASIGKLAQALASEATVTAVILWLLAFEWPAFAGPRGDGLASAAEGLSPLALLGWLLSFAFGGLAYTLWEARHLWSTAPWSPDFPELDAQGPALAQAAKTRFRLRRKPHSRRNRLPRPAPNARLVTLPGFSAIVVDRELVARHSPEELEAILVHEIGHAQLGQGRAVYWRNFFLWSAVASGLLHLQAFIPAILLVIISLKQVFTLSQPIRHALAWKREFAADQWAIDQLKGPSGLKSALERTFATASLDVVTWPSGLPSKIWALWTFNHPPLDLRIRTWEWNTLARAVRSKTALIAH